MSNVLYPPRQFEFSSYRTIMDTNRLFPFKCEICDLSFTKLCSKERHVQTMHDRYKYTCDICFTQFTRMYALNNHKKAGRCKLDLQKNPIVQVTPLGILPSTSTTQKVNTWLNPCPVPTKQPRLGKMDERPSSSNKMDVRPSTSGTPATKGARKQLQIQAATALPPKDEQWNLRVPFSLHLPGNHQDQRPLGDLPASNQQRKETRSPLSLPLPAFALRSPTPTYPDTLTDTVGDGDDSVFSGSTEPAGTPASSTDTHTWDQLAAEVLRGMEAGGEANPPPSGSPSPAPSPLLHQDLALSEDTSSIPDSASHLSGPTAPPTRTESTTSSSTGDNEVTQHLLPGTSWRDQDLSAPANLTEAVDTIKKDLHTLMALNSKVAPRDQMALLCELHGRLQGFMAPYLLYHKV